jgi:hypothetical protein
VKRTLLARRTPLKAKRKPKGTDLALARFWWQKVAQGRSCVVCRSTYRVQGHHVTPQQAIKQKYPRGHPDGRTLQELLWSVANGVAVCERCHANHELAVRRIPAEKLPMDAIRFAVSVGLEERIGPGYYPRSSSALLG